MKFYSILFTLICLLGTLSPCFAYTQKEAQNELYKKNLSPSSKLHFVIALQKGDTETAKLFVDAKEIDLNTRYLGSTYLIEAVVRKHYDIAMYLLENGANPNLKTIDGGSPLFFAVKDGETQVVKKMLETPGMNIKRHRMFFRLPLKTTAKRNGYTEIYDMLVKYQEEYEASKK